MKKIVTFVFALLFAGNISANTDVKETQNKIVEDVRLGMISLNKSRDVGNDFWKRRQLLCNLER